MPSDVDSPAQATARAGQFTAKVLPRGLPPDEGQAPAEKTEKIVTDVKGEKHTQDVRCLFCEKKTE